MIEAALQKDALAVNLEQEHGACGGSRGSAELHSHICIYREKLPLSRDWIDPWPSFR